MRLEMGWGSEHQTFKVEKNKKFTAAPGQAKLNVAFLGNPALKPEKKPGNAPKTELDYVKENLEAQKKSAAIKALEGKMKGGQKLTSDELDYLREHSPELYEKYQKIAREREAYKQELEKANSKEEVRKIHERKAQEFIAEAKAIEGSNLPKEQKTGEMEFLMMRVNAVFNEYNTFLQSDEFKKLPERAEDKKDEAEKQPEMPKEDDEEMTVSGGLGELPGEAGGDIGLPGAESGGADDPTRQLDDFFADFFGSGAGGAGSRAAGTGEAGIKPNIPAADFRGGHVDVKA
ncbi:MAG: hypothetical protein FWB85_04165 [Chitinispirillia bacterium]|nr:hypothetical protein [Chitinispirillia bacterium]MCL2242501.1 hypothetical protein [Chitinispirillia bacterium]